VDYNSKDESMLKNQQGFTLVEFIVSIIIMVMLMGAAFHVISTSVGGHQYGKKGI
jgi:prepilin-type N-terminal cleavage/methylation domain-containing protein